MGKRPSAQQRSLLRAETIMKVRCGLLTAAQAAERLGVSRKTYYKWEQRGLSALLDGVSDQNPGRPAVSPLNDQHRELEKRLAEATAEIDLLNHKLELKDVLMDLKLPAAGLGRTKKK